MYGYQLRYLSVKERGKGSSQKIQGVFERWELFCSFMSLIRVEPDEIIRVITGFGPDGEYGFYEYNDNSAMRIVGFLFWLAALALRLFMLHCIWHQLFMGGVQLK